MCFEEPQTTAVLADHNLSYKAPIDSLFEVYPLLLSMGWYQHASTPIIDTFLLSIPSTWGYIQLDIHWNQIYTDFNEMLKYL